MQRRTIVIFLTFALLTASGFVLLQSAGVRALLIGSYGFTRDALDPRILYEDGVNEADLDITRNIIDSCISEIEIAHGRPFPKAVSIYICATQESFNKRTAAALNGNARGAVFANRLFLSPRSYTTNTHQSILTHELSHLHFRQALGTSYTTGFPAWFQEGMAVYVSNGGGAEPVPAQLAYEAILRGNHISPEDYGSNVPRMSEAHGLPHHMFYRQAEVFTKYLATVQPNKFQKFIDLLFGGESFKVAFESAYEKSVAECWQDFVRKLQFSESAPNPGPRYGHDMVYDEARDLILLFGGFHCDGEPLGDTWAWNGRTWRQVATDGPSARKWPAMSYDAGRGQVLLFGGRTGVGQSGASLSDTWMWDSEAWHELDVSGPPSRDHHRMIYDRHRKRSLLFGGWDGEKLLADTWVWDGKQWIEVAIDGPSARAPTGLAYDERNEQVILFGGKTLDEFFADTWVWDGVQWRELDVAGPSPRAFHAMAYDSNIERILLFSGRIGNTMLRDTWSWNGKEWKQLSDEGPTKRGVYALVYDRVRDYALFYGSGVRADGKWKLAAETWIWKERSWILLP